MGGGIEHANREEDLKKEKLRREKYTEDKQQWLHDKRVLQAQIGKLEIKKQHLINMYLEEDGKYVEDIIV